MIVYLHGFASSGNSEKAQALIARFGRENVWNPDLPIDPVAVVNLVKTELNNRNIKMVDKLIFVGTSLGAFYATYFSLVFDAPCVIVNPSILPHKSLSHGTHINHVTKDEFVVSLCDLHALEHMKEVCDQLYEGPLINLFVAKDDEVLDYNQMLDYYKHTNSTVITETGGHRFTEHWNKVVDKVAELI